MATQKTYTNAEINAALKAAVEEKGEDYTYPSTLMGCFYQESGQPSCIVGHVLYSLDPEMFQRVAEWEASSTSGGNTRFIYVVDELSLPFRTDQVGALQAAQDAQDLHQSWGTAALDYANVLGEVL